LSPNTSIDKELNSSSAALPLRNHPLIDDLLDNPLFDFNLHRHDFTTIDGEFAEISERVASPLVNTAIIASASAKTPDSQLKRERQFTLLSHARNILVDANIKNSTGTSSHRTCTCHTRKAASGDNPTIKLPKDPDNRQATIGNVQTCGSVWSCPVCYERKALSEGLTIQKEIDYAKKNGLEPMMIVLTASHSREMSLTYSKSTFKDAWDSFNAHRQWKKFKRKFKVRYVITNVDITWTPANGWHYHKHLLLFLDRDGIDLAEAFLAADALLTDVWQQQLENNERQADSEHGLFVSERGKSATDYIAKIGITIQDNGKLHFEMTSSKTKNSYTVWDLLTASLEGSIWARKLYIEYVVSMSGDNWITHGRGKTNMKKLVEDYELEGIEKQETFRHWAKFSDYWWDIVVWADNGQSRILRVAARKRDIEEVRDELFKLREELIESNSVSDYYRLFLPEENSISDMRIHEDW